ncbi:uncharacterized protein K452DRAFT_323716 [Aplosporella prunicola CBS 121167]|uniref:Major facilitator superfamily (MFS) profile domain-containing protein n=1 Tax=Aplosporella prunicola CBS 121167 TaxID=1176127 RepID=A0A6A6BR37_9PEZI|nr:uncharacterized protein K452DRAFT_323716 [Aplosporella prunicola CBS 121167]KAF2146546.1 hypothetical protein K452DRAFT_323716 [Aplosporella prunicola CBS 121167]
MSIPLYIKVSILVAFGGMLFGLDTGTIGPVTSMASFKSSFGSLSPTLHGVVVSSILIPAALSSLITGNVADLYGRPRTIMVGATIFGIGAAIEAAANSLGAFIAGRVITGLGEGLFLSVLTVYVCEISPAKQRGALASLIQMLVTIGVATGYFVSYGTSRINSSASWRVPLALQSFISLSFAVSCSLVPPSPRWLLSQGRAKEAALTLSRLGISPTEHEDIVQVQGIDLDFPPSKASLFHSIRATFKDLQKVFAKNARKRTALGCFMMAMQQFSGIDGILFYAPLLFAQAGLPGEQATFLASGVSALVILVVTVPASLLTDRRGRRSSTIFGGLGLMACMVLIGSLYASNSVHVNHGAARWMVIVTIYIFAVIFSISWAIDIKIYSSEIQPAATRASATSLAHSANWLANFVVALTTPIFLDKSSYGVYYFFGACTLLTVIICIFAMPETRGNTLETIDASFQNHSWLGNKSFLSRALRPKTSGIEANTTELQPVSRRHLPTTSIVQ